MSNNQQGVPWLNASMVDNRGIVTQPWYLFFINLWQRTGGGTGLNFAPGDGTYIVASAETGLNNANVASPSSTTTWDFSHANQARVNVTLSSIVIPESQVINLTSDLAARTLVTTQVIAGTGLTGGGTLNGNVTLAVAGNGITNYLLAQMPTNTIKGNNAVGTANAADLTVAQVNAILPVFTNALNGLVPLSGGGTTNYLRADASFANPLAAGTSGTVSLAKLTSGGSNGSLTVANGLITVITNPT
jgi:hypothetical protein